MIRDIYIISNENEYLDSHPQAIIRCPICGEEYIRASIIHAYCPHCGIKMFIRHEKQLERKCSNCNTLSPKEARYCRLCGKKMGDNDSFVYDAKVFPPYHLGRDDVPSNGDEMSSDWFSKNYEFVDLGLSVFWGAEALLTNRQDCTSIKASIWMHEESMSFRSWSSFGVNLQEEIAFYKKKGFYRSIWFNRYDLINRELRGKCRVPTKEEVEELLTKCKWKPESRTINCDSSDSPKCQKGFRITGPSGMSLFMSEGRYWTSMEAGPGKAFALVLNSTERKVEMLNTLRSLNEYINMPSDSLRYDSSTKPSNGYWWPVMGK
jgi:hypothetical protein